MMLKAVSMLIDYTIDNGLEKGDLYATQEVLLAASARLQGVRERIEQANSLDLDEMKSRYTLARRVLAYFRGAIDVSEESRELVKMAAAMAA